MATNTDSNLNRRRFLRLGLVVPASAALVAGASQVLGNLTGAAPGQSLGRIGGATPMLAQELSLTPSCDENPQATPAQTEGPYFTRNSPERRSLLEPGMGGTHLLVAGFVLSSACQLVAGALVDFWQCDAAGRYDNQGYTLRGHQFTDESGRFELETIVPGLYPGRTRHIHVKVQAPNAPVLTTQLYFPDEPGNQRDGIYRPALVLATQDTDTGKAASFNFVVATA
jgi:protocatechuate 3,4-dioxygenase beta subunit